MEAERLIFVECDVQCVLPIVYLASYLVDNPFHKENENPFVSIVTTNNGHPASLDDLVAWLSSVRAEVPDIVDEPNVYSSIAFSKKHLRVVSVAHLLKT